METLRTCWAILLEGREGWDAAYHLHRIIIGCLVMIATILLILIVGPEQ